jgi:NADPH:quinone reductase-like Zn-dependent oxidoreductase
MNAFTTLGDGIAALKLGERPAPRPGPDEVLVKMTAAALNFRDLLVINGTGPWKPHARASRCRTAWVSWLPSGRL